MTDSTNLVGHTVVVGFGMPGRAVAEMLRTEGRPYCVIELNAGTVNRCQISGTPIILGDASDPQVLRSAGVEHAAVVVVAVPNDEAALAITGEVRKLNKHAILYTRCHYTSAGIQARALGANVVLVEEQIVANELLALFTSGATNGGVGG